MHTRFPSTLFCGLLIIFTCVYTIVCNDKVREKKYCSYILAVIQHFQTQSGWSSMEHITMMDDNLTTDLSIGQVLHGDLSDPEKVVNLYNKIVELVNCSYADILKTILFQLTSMTNECIYLNPNNSYEFVVHYIVSLQDLLKYSLILVDNLYSALTFLSLIDVKNASTHFKNYTDYIVDELYSVKDYVYSMKKLDYSTHMNNDGEALAVLESIMQFCLETSSKLSHVLSKSSNVIIHSNFGIDFKQVHEIRLKSDNLDFVRYISAMLKKYMDEADTNDFINLGFSQLMHPTHIG